MPWTSKQRRLFNAAAHDPAVADQHGMSGKTSRELAHEANELKGEGKERKPVSKGPELVSIDLIPVFGRRPR